MEEINKNEWNYFSDKDPEPYKNINIYVDDEIIETYTYLHNGKLMLECGDGNM